MSIQDTKERIFVNGQIYSRPIGGGPVHGPDTRRFTPDPNPYDVPPEPRGYGQGTVDDLLFRPGIDKFEIENPVLRPGDTYEVLPLDYLNQYLNNRGIVEQNQEVMGLKEQVFPRYANPADGTLNNMLMAADPSFAIPREVSPQEVKQINRRVISDYEKKKEMLRRGLLAPLLRGV